MNAGKSSFKIVAAEHHCVVLPQGSMSLRRCSPGPGQITAGELDILHAWQAGSGDGAQIRSQSQVDVDSAQSGRKRIHCCVFLPFFRSACVRACVCPPSWWRSAATFTPRVSPADRRQLEERETAGKNLCFISVYQNCLRKTQNTKTPPHICRQLVASKHPATQFLTWPLEEEEEKTISPCFYQLI